MSKSKKSGMVLVPRAGNVASPPDEAKTVVHKVGVPSDLELELKKLQEENARLKAAQTAGGMTLKVSEKGAVSMYGIGRFPVTLYYKQWLRLVEEIKSGRLEAFLEQARKDGKLSLEKVPLTSEQKARQEAVIQARMAQAAAPQVRRPQRIAAR